MPRDSCVALTFREDCLNQILLADGTSVTPALLKGGQACFMSRTGAQIPGDCNNDRLLNIADAICLFGFLFLGSPSQLGGAPVPADRRLSDAVQLKRTG